MTNTSEWVSLGHPDKTADYITSYILDRFLEVDPKTRYAVEVQIKDRVVNIAGEITSKMKWEECDIKAFTKEAIRDIGYTQEYAEKFGKDKTIDCENIDVNVFIGKQSEDISVGVDNLGWGDQGIFFGYARKKRPNYIDLDVDASRAIGKRLYSEALKNKDGLGIDIKTQVTVEEAGGQEQISQVIVAIPMKEEKKKKLFIDVVKMVHEEISRYKFKRDVSIIVNGTGSYETHSSMGDTGVTGRKLAVDFYGGRCKVGGGSFFSKDGTKADVALNLYAFDYAKTLLDELSDRKEVDYVETQISCCIGKMEIIRTASFYSKEGIKVASDITDRINLPTADAINSYDLNQPIFTKLCRDGIFSLLINSEREGA